MGPKKEEKHETDDDKPRKSKATIAKEEAVKQMKAQLNQGLAAFELEEDEDVFDIVDEKEYVSVVEARRNKGDFVVDDGKSYDFQEMSGARLGFAQHLHRLTSPPRLLPPPLSRPPCLDRRSWLRRRRRGDSRHSR